MVVRESADPKARVPVNWRSVFVSSNDSTAEFKLKTELTLAWDASTWTCSGLGVTRLTVRARTKLHRSAKLSLKRTVVVKILEFCLEDALKASQRLLS